MQMNNTLKSCPQAFWSPNDTGLVFVGWWHEPFRLGVKYCANRRWVMGKYVSDEDNLKPNLFFLLFKCTVLRVECLPAC